VRCFESGSKGLQAVDRFWECDRVFEERAQFTKVAGKLVKTNWVKLSGSLSSEKKHNGG
jgi:hypothetical protein